MKQISKGVKEVLLIASVLTLIIVISFEIFSPKDIWLYIMYFFGAIVGAGIVKMSNP